MVRLWDDNGFLKLEGRELSEDFKKLIEPWIIKNIRQVDARDLENILHHSITMSISLQNVKKWIQTEKEKK